MERVLRQICSDMTLMLGCWGWGLTLVRYSYAAGTWCLWDQEMWPCARPPGWTTEKSLLAFVTGRPALDKCPDPSVSLKPKNRIDLGLQRRWKYCGRVMAEVEGGSGLLLFSRERVKSIRNMDDRQHTHAHSYISCWSTCLRTKPHFSLDESWSVKWLQILGERCY